MNSFADSYNRHFKGSFTSQDFLSHPFFIGVLEYDAGPDVFQQYKFTTVPHFVYFPPGQKSSDSIGESNTLHIHAPSAEDIASFVHNKVGVEIPIYKNPLFFYLTVALVVASIFMATRLARGFVSTFRTPLFWYAVAVAGYFVVMAGITYDILRNPPWSEANPWSGQVQYISPQARTQFVAEGFIIASLLTTTGLLFVAIGDGIPRIQSKKKQNVLFAAACLALLVCLSMINSIFAMKYHMPAFHLKILSR